MTIDDDASSLAARGSPTPGELLLLLYRGLFGFLEQAMACFDNDQDARGRELIGKSRAIVQQLLLSLDHELAPELCAGLSEVANFALHRLSEADRSADARPVRDALRALTPLREAWEVAVPEASAVGMEMTAAPIERLPAENRRRS